MWRTRSIFVSSTFKDMHAERDYLRNQVFPDLEERLRALRHHLEWVDLRIGADRASPHEEEARESRVLNVCAGEVRRCRPFMIVLLGDRYGYVPKPQDIAILAAEEKKSIAELAGRSVTELEIELGILSDAGQQPRCLFYFREPLPYERMNSEVVERYTDTRDPRSTPAVRLADLKRRIEQRMPPERVKRYQVACDHEGRISGLKAWGDMVREHLWSELEAEIGRFAAESELTWQQHERNALDEFIEDRTRDFVGREDILGQLTLFASSGPSPDAARGVCVAADAGSGKSALLAALYRRLTESGAFVLAHATAASPRSASVDAMLLRWIDELAAELGTARALPDNPNVETIEAAFASLLDHAASRKRVVILIDGLDQFEATARGRHVTWLPRALPDNVRLVASAIAGDASGALSRRSDFRPVPLPPMHAANAREIVHAICRRYHRVLEPKVIDALITHATADGTRSANPLWLVIASEDLNLIDRHDLDLIGRQRLGSAGTDPGGWEEQVRALMLHMIRHYPSNISGLYAHTFERAEKHLGTALVRGFLRLIAVSRAGLHEHALCRLLPQASRLEWDAQDFADVRRIFRGQLRRRGPLEQWDFAHEQMRLAARARLFDSGGTDQLTSERQLHALLAVYLTGERSDPLRLTETMVHLLGSGTPTVAALYFGDAHLTEEETEGASRVLADAIITAEDPEAAVGRATAMLSDDVDEAVRANAAHRFLYDVADAIKGRASLATQQCLLAKIAAALDRVLASFPADSRALRDLSACHSQTGDLLTQSGRQDEGLDAYERGLAIAESLSDRDPENGLFQSFMIATCQRIGDVLISLGRAREAVQFYWRAVTVSETLLERSPDNLTYKNALALSLQKIAERLAAVGSVDEALQYFRRSTGILREIIAEDSHDEQALEHLAMNYLNSGVLWGSVGESSEALASCRDCIEIRRRLASWNPASMAMQRELAVAHSLLADLLEARGQHREAFDGYRESLASFEQAAEFDPGNLVWKHDLSIGYARLGEALLRRNHGADSLVMMRKAVALGEELVGIDPDNAKWQSSLATAYLVLGNVLMTLGQPEDANAMQGRGFGIRQKLGIAES
jgi:tetratricopeptide (TPR) repeat protein